MITGIYQKSLPYRLLENIRDAAGRFIFNYSLIKRGIEGVEILRVKAVGGQAEGFTETLVMHDLPRAQEFDGVADIGIVAHTENVVVGGACLLL